jgi:hypothetical protein
MNASTLICELKAAGTSYPPPVTACMSRPHREP